MITEDYVSFETAKLLKEKGFDAECKKYYNLKMLTNLYYGCEYVRNRDLKDEDDCIAPSIYVTMKWLREKHYKSIEIRSQGLKVTSIGWIVGIYNLVNQDEEFHHPYTFPTYEEACEAAIKYCLENLI